MNSKNNKRENYILAYDELEKVKDLPKELGIYKVKIKIDRVDDYGYLFIDSIELTDEIGTVLYEGKTFETNDLDDTVNVKDKICGLIKTSGYSLIYNHGMGAGPGEVITEIISSDENYKNMFKMEENQFLEYECIDDDFAIVAATKHKENYEHISTDYYYINKKSPVKIHLLTSDNRYDYIVKSKENENEFILSTEGFNTSTGNTELIIE